MHTESQPDVPPEVMRAIAAGRKIEAIKLLREHSGIGLKQAKAVVDSIAQADAGFAAGHRAAPANDTGIGRFVVILVLVGVVIAGYLWMQG